MIKDQALDKITKYAFNEWGTRSSTDNFTKEQACIDGGTYVLLHPEEFGLVRGSDMELIKGVLQQIVDWKLPETGKFWDEEKTRPTSYETEYGSNGARDYIKKLAEKTLTFINTLS